MWLKKEKKEESVTLTLTLIAFVAVLIGSGLHMAGVVSSTSVLFETFAGCLAAYLGRRINFNGKTFEPSKANENEK